MKLFFSIGSLFLIVFASLTTLAATPLTELVDKLQATWDKTQQYRANFKQVVYSKKLRTREVAEGTFYVSKPGKIRWEVPSQKTVQIISGNRLIILKENKRRKTTTVDIYKDISKSVDLKALSFLAGGARFKETYQSELGAEDAEKIELKFTPKNTADESYLAEIDKKSYLLRALTTETADSKVRIDFSNTETNLELNPGLFEFKPKGSEIIRENPWALG